MKAIICDPEQVADAIREHPEINLFTVNWQERRRLREKKPNEPSRLCQVYTRDHGLASRLDQETILVRDSDTYGCMVWHLSAENAYKHALAELRKVVTVSRVRHQPS